MSQPLPSQIILPTGQPAYLNPYRGTYTTSRSYGLRMQRNYARGIGQSEARGHGISPFGLTEYQARALNFQQTYGFSFTTWRRWQRRYLNEINSERSPAAQITPMVIAQDLDVNRSRPQVIPGIIIPAENITEERLAELLYATREYKEGNSAPGRNDFFTRENIRPIELWWYH